MEGIQKKRKNYLEERAQNCQRTTDTERSPEREHAVPNDHTLQPCDLPDVTPTGYLHCGDSNKAIGSCPAPHVGHTPRSVISSLPALVLSLLLLPPLPTAPVEGKRMQKSNPLPLSLLTLHAVASLTWSLSLQKIKKCK